jgi:hypothetical protein
MKTGVPTNNGNNQISAWQGRRHTHIDIAPLDDFIAIYRDINHREVFDGFHQCFDKDGCKCELSSFLLLELFT